MRGRIAILATLVLGSAATVAMLVSALGAGDADRVTAVPEDSRDSRPSAVRWVDELVGRAVRPGALAGAHTSLEGITRCMDCHGAGSHVPDSRCLSCHEEIAVREERSLPLHGTFEGTCASCHPDHGGTEVTLIDLDESAFQHDRTRFPLRGGHAELECRACHELQEDGREDGAEFHFQGAPLSGCVACHVDPHLGGERTDGASRHPIRRIGLDAPPATLSPADPRHPIGNRDCAGCHAEATFRTPGLRDGFDHDRDTHFALEGVHRDVGCAGCHTEEDRTKEMALGLAPGTLRDEHCASCHEDPHSGAVGDAASCGRCHVPTGWNRNFDHDRHTDFALDALHVRLACSSCHEDQRYRAAGETCRECHSDAAALLAGRFGSDAGAPDPHAEGVKCVDCHGTSLESNRLPGLSEACERCHNESYAELPAVWRARLDGLAIRIHDQSDARERLRASGSHNFLLASRILGDLAGEP